MAEAAPWPGRGAREGSHDATTTPDREDGPRALTERGVSTAVTPWGHEGPDAEVAVTTPGDHEGDEPPGRLSAIQEFRFAHEGRATLRERIDYALYAAYTMPKSWRRTVNIGYLYTVGIPGMTVTAAIEWVFFFHPERALLGLMVAVALGFTLNHLPAVEWLVPDWVDISWWVSGDDLPECSVELPLDPGVGG